MEKETPQFGTKEWNDLASAYFGGKPIPKQETLEDFLYQYWYDSPTLNIHNKETFIDGGLLGAKWQAERSYSEDEVRIMLSESFKASQEGYNITSDEIIEQFKKK